MNIHEYQAKSLLRRAGATGPIESVYIHDPDENLLEIANRSAA